jgi:uncharacterized protein (DUF58 family)
MSCGSGEAMADEQKKRATCALVIGTRHQFQRHQDTMADREKARAEFDRRLREIIKERKIDFIAEEAGDDTEVWKRLKQQDEAVGELAELFGEGSTTGDSPVPTIAKKIADENGVRHEDVDVEVRANEKDLKSIGKRDEGMTEKILKVSGAAESVLVIVGEAHRARVAERLRKAGWSVE